MLQAGRGPPRHEPSVARTRRDEPEQRFANAYSGVLGFGATADNGGYFVKSNGKSAMYPGTSTNYDGTGAITFGTTNWNDVDATFGPTTYSTRRNAVAVASGVAWAVGLLPYFGMMATSTSPAA